MPRYVLFDVVYALKCLREFKVNNGKIFLFLAGLKIAICQLMRVLLFNKELNYPAQSTFN